MSLPFLQKKKLNILNINSACIRQRTEVTGLTATPKSGETCEHRELQLKSVYLEKKLEPEASRNTSMVILRNWWRLSVE